MLRKENPIIEKNEFFYEFNCIEDGRWVPEKQTFEDRLVMDLRFIWNHRYNLERRYSQQHLRSDAARWRFKRLSKRIPQKAHSQTSGIPQ